MNKTKIALLGGAFNPPTLGHIELAKHVIANTEMTEVWLLPCYGHRSGKELEDAMHRSKMCVIAAVGHRDIRACKYEIHKKMEGSTFDFLTDFLSNPSFEGDFRYIIGQDNANEFHTWHESEKLKELCKFIVVGRTGYEDIDKDAWYHKEPHIYLPWGSLEECSSTDARNHLKSYGRREYLDILDTNVHNYILRNDLYKGE